MPEIRLTLSDLATAYAAGTRPTEVLSQVFARLDAAEDPAIFIAMPDRAALLAEAEALGDHDPAKPLWGVPFAVKDNIDVAGLPTTAACPAYAYVPDSDAFIVARLRAAGALCLGKTNLDQFATGLVGVRSPYGVPRNALDPEIVPGGSSSGSAVAVARGIAAFALGTDTAGSGRVPAALNNIVGLKPTLGAFSANGVVPACRSIETPSVFALTVDDAHAVFRVACAHDPADAFSRTVAAPAPTTAKAPPVIGIPDGDSIRFCGDAVQAESFAASVNLLRGTGAEIREIDFAPLYAVADMLYEGAWVAERYTVIADLLARDPAAILPVTRQIICKAESLSAADAFRGIYRLKELARAAEPALVAVDMLCVPTIPTFYSVDELAVDPVTPNSNLGTYTNFVNLLDMCGLAVPTPARSDGRPGSVTLLAPAGQDAALAATARALEAAGTRTLGATGWQRPAQSPLPAAKPACLTIAVCGAHMTGLPLNAQLTSNGARFLRTARTSDAYRLYALPGGPPARPGLVRGAPGSGAPIALELWELPLDRVGHFLAGIPAPLGLGTVALEDGSSVTGFLCEAVAISGAEDVTATGDWRVHLGARTCPTR